MFNLRTLPLNLKGAVSVIGGAILTLGTALGCLSGPSGAADVTELLLHPTNTGGSPVIQFYGDYIDVEAICSG